MKKYTWLFALFCIVAFLFAGCDNGGGGPKKGGGNSNTKVLYDSTKAGAGKNFVIDVSPVDNHVFPNFPNFTTNTEGAFTVVLAFGKTIDKMIDAREYSKLIIQIPDYTDKVGGWFVFLFL